MTVETIDQGYETDVAPPLRRRRGLLWLTLGVVVLAGAGAGSWFELRGQESGGPSVPTGPAATAEVTRTTISDTETWNGTLGYGNPFAVTASGEGTVTRVADQDSKITRGDELYRLDEKPVTALIGTIPMYRDLSAGDTGIDVKQVESNLAKLGYDGFDVDREFTYYTGLAVKEWQEDLGLEESGMVAQSDVVFIPEGGRVATVHTEIGSTPTPGAAVLDIRGSEQVVSLEVDIADRDLLAVGTEVTVRLAGGKEAAGVVTDIAVVESSSDDGASDDGGSDEGSGSEDAVAEVEVTLNESVDNALLGSPAEVVVAVDEREGVLVVPVTALLALAEGGYGLEIVANDATTSIAPVEVGLFADGQVEVSAEEIDEGTVVGVTGR